MKYVHSNIGCFEWFELGFYTISTFECMDLDVKIQRDVKSFKENGTRKRFEIRKKKKISNILL